MRDDPVTPRWRMAIAVGVVLMAALQPRITGNVVAQQATPAATSAVQVEDLLRSAEQLLLEQRGAQAVVLFERARDSAERLGLDAPRAQALSGIGEARYWQAQYAPAREAASASLAIYERLASTAADADRQPLDHGIGRVSHVLSMVAEQEGKTPEAAQFAARAIAAQEAAGNRWGRAVSTLQLLRVSRLDPAARAPLHERAVADARAAADTVLEARALHSFGDYLFNRGAYIESLPKLEAAGALFAETGRQIELGTVYNSLGRLYRAHGRVDAALDYQLKALAIHEKTSSPFNHLQSLNAVAATYQNLEDYAKARVYYERALALADQTGSPRVRDLLRAGLASSLTAEGDYPQAASILEGVIARNLDAYPRIRLRELAEAYTGMGRYEDAMTAAERATQGCGTREDLDCVRGLDRRAAVHAALGQEDAALADLQAAMTMVETVRGRLVPADFLKQQFSLAQGELYTRAIALQTRAGRNADALMTAELARSRAFVDLLASRDLPFPSTAGGAGIGTREASPAIDGLPIVLRGGGTGAAGAATTRGEQLSSHASVPAASDDELIAVARRLRTTLVAYWVAADRLFIWVVSGDGTVRASQVRVRMSKLQDLVRAATPLVDNRAGSSRDGRSALPARGESSAPLQSGEVRPWRELYDVLLKPVRAMLPRPPGALLTIVPHGPLTSLPFAGLQDERGRYLLEDYTLHYAPGGAVLQFTAARRRADSRQGRFLLVADPVPPTLSSLDWPLPRLPGARAESRAIASLVPRQRVASLEDAAAGERAVRNAVGGKSVLHFATHAIVRDDDPFSSFLAVGRSGEDDGLLTAGEIYGLRLDADLVVLSACRSGSGRVIGDGVATFARAFIYAGTPSVVASLWEVADEPTNRMLPQFYRAWLGGASKARALRAAQLRLLSELRTGTLRIDTPAGRVSLPEHPVFWAGFVLIGEPD